MPAPSTWTFRVISGLTFVGILICIALALQPGQNFMRMEDPPSSFRSKISLDEGTRFEVGVKSAPGLRLLLKGVHGDPLKGEVPVLAATGDEHAKFQCEATNDKGESRCSMTPSIDGALIIRFANQPILERLVVHVFHSGSKFEILEQGSATGDATGNLRWRVRLDKPWNRGPAVVAMEGAGRFAADCSVQESQMDLDCRLSAEAPGAKKIRLLRPLLEGSLDVDIQPAAKAVTPVKKESQIYAIGPAQPKGQMQIVAVRLMKASKPVSGITPRLAVLGTAPVTASCGTTDQEGHAECRLFSMYTQKVDVWISGDFSSASLPFSFIQERQSFNPDFVFGDPAILSIRFESHSKGQYANTIPRLVFPESNVMSECTAEVDGFFDCAMKSPQGGLIKGNYRHFRKDEELLVRDANLHQLEVLFPKPSGS